MKNGINLGAIAGNPASSRGERGSSKTFSKFNINPAPSFHSPPGAKPSFQEVMSLCGAVCRWNLFRLVNIYLHRRNYKSKEANC